ncbi:MAG TPA: hypothetical protein VFD58_17140 [Blastocatellia bacterium]|nr:hypothetical protein [Blastocatellia bacterium]
MGTVSYDIDWDWKKAEEYLKKAVEISPGNSAAHSTCAGLFTTLARFDEAIRERRLELRADPHSPSVIVDFAWTLYSARRYDEAIEQAWRSSTRG